MVSVIEGRLCVDVSRKYISIYRCDNQGVIVDEDHFSFQYRLDRQDAISEVVDLYAMLYDWLNDTINGGLDDEPGDSARGEGPPAKTE